MNIAVTEQPLLADPEGGAHPMFRDVPTSVAFNKLRKRLVRQTREAIEQFGMVKPGDRWLVALSGGKDSYGLLAILLDLKWRGLLPVDLLACNFDQGQPNFPKTHPARIPRAAGIEHRIEYRDTYPVVTDKIAEGSTYCSLCSRPQARSPLPYRARGGCSSLVLGHHREDILETFFMNMFHGGRLAAMPAKQLNDEGDMLVLRPLSFCAEADLEKFVEAMRFPIIPYDLWGSQEGSQPNAMKAMMADIEAQTCLAARIR